MKKEIAIVVFILIVVAASILLSPWIILLAFLCIILEYISLCKIRKLQERYPNWAGFNKNLSRLYPFLLVGGSKSYHLFRKNPLDKEKVVDLTLPHQNMFACQECIRHFFSILKDSTGVVCLAVTEREMRNKNTRLLPFHYTVLRGWLYPDTNHYAVKTKLSLLFQPLWTLECLGLATSRPKKQTNVNGGVI